MSTSTSTHPQTHRALLCTSTSLPLEVTHVPTPPAISGSALVRILAAPILSYARSLYDSTDPSYRAYPFPTPLVPGASAIARITALGPDATASNLAVGQLVYIDGVIRSRCDPADTVFLQGTHQGFGAASEALMRDAWRDGTWAESARVPLESVAPLDEGRLCGGGIGGGAQGLGLTPQQLAGLGRLLVPFGGFKAVGLRAGETVLISPATGAFGGAAVKVALSMGAAVIAMGRNEAALERVRALDTGRVRTVKLSGDAEQDGKALAALGGVDVFFDISPPAALGSGHVKAGILSVKARGRVCLMGGLHGDVGIPHSHVMHKDITIRGKWMYDREDIAEMVKMVEVGVLRLDDIEVAAKFGLEDWDKAFTCAEENAGLSAVTVFDMGEDMQA